MKPERLQGYAFFAVLFSALLLVWLATAQGPGFSPDSISYLKTTRGLLGGENWTQLGTHFPPGMPILWSFLSLVFPTEFIAARVLCALSLVSLLLALVLILRRYSSSNWLIIGILLLPLATSNFIVHFWLALSEAPLLAMFVWALYCTLRIGDGDESRRHWLALMVLLASMLLLRYASLPLVGGLLLFLYLGGPWRDWHWLLRVFWVGLLSILPLGLLLIGSLQLGDQSAVRELAFHPPEIAKLQQLSDALQTWSGGLTALIAVPLWIILVVASLLDPQLRKERLVQSVLVLIICYLAFLAVSVSFVDALTPLDGRILAPLFPLGLCLVYAWLVRLPPVVSGLLLFTWLAFSIPELTRSVMIANTQGLGYSAPAYRDLEILRVVEKLPTEVPVYTNAGEIFYLYLDRETGKLPQIYDPVTLTYNNDVAREWEQILTAMNEQGAIVVWSPVNRHRIYLPTVEDMLAFGDLEIDREVSGGVIMRLRR
jgi:hypothetical protein